MKSAIISIGTELLEGALNTNTSYIGEVLFSLGYDTDLQISVPDDKTLLEKTIKNTILTHDIIILTGGLGPTFDDITREAISSAINRELVYKEEIFQGICDKFPGMHIPEESKKQAFVIDGARILENFIGTAPGMIIELKNSKSLIVLPGPPDEMKPMFKQVVYKYLKDKIGDKYFDDIVIKTAGGNEVLIHERIKDIVEKYENIKDASIRFGILASIGQVLVKCFVKAKTQELVDKYSGIIKKELKEILSDNVFSDDKSSLEKILAEKLIAKSYTVSIAESCTGGMLGAKLTSVPGSSAYFIGGVIAYSNDIKTNVLNVDKDIIKKHGAVSEEVCELLARNIKEKFNSNIGLSITGLAGPGGETESKQVGLVYMGIMINDDIKVFKYNLKGFRDRIREKTVILVLDNLRRMLGTSA